MGRSLELMTGICNDVGASSNWKTGKTLYTIKSNQFAVGID